MLAMERAKNVWWRAPLALAITWVGAFAQIGNVGDWMTTLVGVGLYHRHERGQVVLWAIRRFGLVPGVTLTMAAWAAGFAAAAWAGRRWVDGGSLPATTLVLTAYFGTLKWAVVIANIVAILAAP